MFPDTNVSFTLLSQLQSWPRAGSNPSSLAPGWGGEEEKGRVEGGRKRRGKERESTGK